MKTPLIVLSALGMLLLAGCQNTPQTRAEQNAMNKANTDYQKSMNSGAGSIDAPSDENPTGLGAGGPY